MTSENAPTASSSSTSTEGQTILVVDDEPTLRLGFQYALETEGYTVETCPDGQSALDRLEDGTPPRAMVLDLRMPGVGGMEVMRNLSEREIWQPTIVASAYIDSKTAVEAIELGVVDFLAKPVTPDHVRGAVDQVLHEERRFSDALETHPSQIAADQLLAFARVNLRRCRLEVALDALREARERTDGTPPRELSLWLMIAHHLKAIRKGEGERSEFASSRFYAASNLLQFLAYNEAH